MNTKRTESAALPATSTPMQFLVYTMIFTVLVVGYLNKTLQLSRMLALLPDLLSVIAAVIVIAKLPANRFRDIDGRYMIIFGLLVFNFIAGAILNDLPSGVIVTGLRKYFGALFFFFLPLVVLYDDRALRKQLTLIAFICLFQFPLAFQQRAATEASWRAGTGDYTFGTIMNSAAMSIFLCCVAAVAVGLHVRHHLRMRNLILFLAATMPATMINETKGTLFLVPIAFMVPLFLVGEGSKSALVKRAIVGVSILAVFAGTFIPVYDYYIRERWGYGLIEFYQMEGRAETYLSSGTQVGDEKAGRIDSMRLPFTTAGGDVSRIAFGLGMGNLTHSSQGDGFMGEYYERYGNYVGPTISILLWETGLFGLLLVFWLLYRVFKETLLARAATGLSGAFAVGWTGVLGVMVLSMAYNITLQSIPLSYLFWFYSGVVSAAAMRVRRSQEQTAKDSSRYFSAPANSRLLAAQRMSKTPTAR